MVQASVSQSLNSGAVIQIASIPRQFYIDSLGSLAEFFMPLLNLTREAIESQRTRDDKDRSVAYNAASHLAGELLREGSCMIGREFLNVANTYHVDFESDQFTATAQVYAVGGGKAASFFVRITGKIMGDTFLVSDPGSDRQLFHFSEAEARKPDFFSREFPFIANQSRLHPTKAPANGLSSPNDQAIDLQMTISVLGENRAVRICKARGSERLEVLEAEGNTRVAYFPATCLSDFPKLTQSIQEYMTMCARGGSPPEDSSTDPSLAKQFTKAPVK